MLDIEYDCNTYYPLLESAYHPSVLYPEYPWNSNEISFAKNDVYNMLRNIFIRQQMDKDNLGTKKWNPLGEYIRPGQTVLLKPNWVSHKNKLVHSDDSLICLVTHPSLVRVIVDYVVIALKGKGKIILGDAPMQGTDLDKLLELSGYNQLFSFFKKKNITIDICDFRKYKCVYKNGIISGLNLTDSFYKSTLVSLGKKSVHSENDKKDFLYKVSDYDYHLTQKYHSSGVHTYEVNEAVLLADVLINIPKPKTHRLAGITGAMKNIVGIAYEKASLPHRALGDRETGKGDAYYKKNIFKMYMEHFDNKQTIYSTNGSWIYAKFFDILKKAFYIGGALLSGDKYRIGSWYGNDTIWRTVIDLDYIVNYADQKGVICDEPQRRILNIGDMIVCGEKEGPIGPSPKYLGMIMISEDMFLFDYTLSRIMGFNPYKIPSLAYILKNHKDLVESIVLSNDPNISNKVVSNLIFPEEMKFEPHSCWKGHIENTF